MRGARDEAVHLDGCKGVTVAEKDWSKAEIDDIECYGETDGGALRCRDRANGKTFTIPKKLVDEDSEVYAKHTDGKLVIPAWLATEKGLV